MVLVVVGLFTGCTSRTSTFHIIDQRDGLEPVHYRQTFDQAYYDVDDTGHVDIVFQRTDPASKSASSDRHAGSLDQMIHLRSVWQSIPGDTVADRTQINGTVRYCIRYGGTLAILEGGGSLFFKLNERDKTLSGSLDLAWLRSRRRSAAGDAFLERAEISGHFLAVPDARRVTRIRHRMDRLWGASARVAADRQ